MRKYIVFIFLTLWCEITFAQDIQDIGKIVLGVDISPNASAETKTLWPQLQNKLRQLATQGGYSSYGDNDFVICPNVIINNCDMAEGGMKNVYLVSGDLYLTIQDKNNGNVYSNLSYPFKNSALARDKAIRNGILNISYNSISALFDEAKAKILSYYESKQDAIFAEAETYTQNNQFDEAITCLMRIPQDLFALHQKALLKANEIYERRDEFIQRQHEMANEDILSKAKSILANHEPQRALELLYNYSPINSEQDKEYNSIISIAEQQVSAQERAEYLKERRAYLDNKQRENKEYAYRNAVLNKSTRLEQQRINAIKTIACEYIRNKYKSNY